MTEQQQQSPPHQAGGEDWKKKAEEYLAGWKRAKADFINFQRETEKRNAEFVQFAHTGILLAFLPIYENVRKAYDHAKAEANSHALAIGLEKVKKQCEDFLQQFDVQPIATQDQAFDPTMHEAVSQEKKEGIAKGTILSEVQIGYTIHGKLLRPSKVIVAA